VSALDRFRKVAKALGEGPAGGYAGVGETAIADQAEGLKNKRAAL
jgi:hypothetical protein